MRYTITLWLISLALVVKAHSHEAQGPRLESKTEARFVKNIGQWEDFIGHRLQLRQGRVYIHADGYTVHLLQTAERGHKNHHHGIEKAHAYRVRFIGANKDAQFIEDGRYDDYENYFIGKNPEKWRSQVPVFRTAGIKNLYPGIDLWFKEHQGELKYEFHLRPNANPEQIRFVYEGVARPTVKNGSLQIHTICGMVKEMPPVTYSLSYNGQQRLVASAFELQGQVFKYRFPKGYDRKFAHIIDPTLIFSTYTGSTADNWGFTATPGEDGTAYTAGVVFGGGYPTTLGAYDNTFNGSLSDLLNTYDIGIMKFNATGNQRLYATYLGGNEGETPNSLVVDRNNNLIVMGVTSSSNFPVTNSAYQPIFRGGTSIAPAINSLFLLRQGADIFVSKFNATGTQLLGSTYVGGTGNDGVLAFTNAAEGQELVKNYGDSYRGDVITDEQGNIYVASNTSSTNFPVVNAIQATKRQGKDGVIFKLSPGLNQMLWSTYYGGDGMDAFYSIQIDRAGNVYAAGGTTSANLQGTAGAFRSNFGGVVDGMVVRIRQTPTPSLSRATYIGTSAYDQVFFIQLDTAQQVYLFGQTLGDYPVTPGTYHNVNSRHFLHKLNNNLNSDFWSTVFGANSSQTNISPTAFLVDTCGKLYISGWGGSVNQQPGYFNANVVGMPTTPDAIYPNTTDGSDFYFAVFAPNASGLIYGSYFGSPITADHVDGGTSRFDKAGVIYQAVCAGCGGSSSFPTTPGVVGPNNLSTNCNNALIKLNFAQLRISLELAVTTFCSPASVSIVANSPEGQIFYWDFGDGAKDTTTTNTYVHNYQSAGTFVVRVTAVNPSACPDKVLATATITVLPTPVFSDTTLYMCATGPIALQTNVPAGLTYRWSPGQWLNDSTTRTPIANINGSTTFSLTATNAQGCSLTRTVSVIDGRLLPNVLASPLAGCQPLTVNFNNQSTGLDSMVIIIADTGLVVNPPSSFSYTIGGFGNGVIQVRLFGEPNCANKDTLFFPFQINAAPIHRDTIFKICNFGESLSLAPAASPNLNIRWLNPVNLSDSIGYTVVATAPEPMRYFVLLTDSLGCSDTANVLLVEGRLAARFAIDTSKGCAPFSPVITDNSFNAASYAWYILPNDSLISSTTAVNYSFNTPGNYTLKLLVKNATTCALADSALVPIAVGGVPTPDSLSLSFCPGDTLNPSILQGPYTYSWTPGLYVIDSLSGNTAVVPYSNTTYNIRITDSLGCSATQYLDLQQIRLQTPISITNLYNPCTDVHTYRLATAARADVNYFWQAMGRINGSVVEVNFPGNGSYPITVYAQKGRCIDSLRTTLAVENTPSPLKALASSELIFGDCNGIPAIKLTNKSLNAKRILWLLPDERTDTAQSIIYQPTAEGRQNITLTAFDDNCVRTFSPNLAVFKIEIPNLITPNGDFKNDVFAIKGLSAPYALKIYDRWGKIHFQTDDYLNNWPGNQQVTSQIYYYNILINNELKCKGWLQVAK